MNFRKLILALALLSIFTTSYTQVDSDSELFKTLKEKDSLIFSFGYNECDSAVLRFLLSDDFEMWHDQGGLQDSKEMFLQGVPNLCNMSYKASRELVFSTLQVFPLYAQGKLYGAIQKGMHKFWGEEPGKPKYITSTSRFSHVWRLENDEWRLTRILSYDHVVPE